MLKTILLRLLGSMLAGVMIAGMVSELAFRALGNTTSRAPETVRLVIPLGTSEKVAQGKTVLANELTFVTGDTLVLVNEDAVAHTLGAMYVPAGTTASLKLELPEKMKYACSFSPTLTFGLDVREALTLSTRLEGLAIAGIPMGLLLFVYSLVALPLNSPKAKKPGETSQQAMAQANHDQ